MTVAVGRPRDARGEYVTENKENTNMTTNENEKPVLVEAGGVLALTAAGVEFLGRFGIKQETAEHTVHLMNRGRAKNFGKPEPKPMALTAKVPVETLALTAEEHALAEKYYVSPAAMLRAKELRIQFERRERG